MLDKTVVRVMNRLFEKGYTTEKDISALDLRDQLELQLTAQNEVKVIVELKDAVKQGKVISYLSGELNKPAEKKLDAKAAKPAEHKPEQKPENRFY